MSRALHLGPDGQPQTNYRCDSCGVEASRPSENSPEGWEAGWVRPLPEQSGVQSLRRVDLCPLCAARTPLATWGGEPPRPVTPLHAEAEELFRAMADERPQAARLPARGEGLRGWLRRLVGRRGA